MRKTRLNWTVKRFNKEMASNLVSFDYPIQRSGGQWNDLSKSLLIHSLATDFPVPPLYAVPQKEIIGDKEKEILYILDGKQRSTNIQSFIKGEFRLHEETPPIKLNGEVYNVANFKFDELPDDVQEAIQEFTLDIFKLEEADDEIIEEVFYRLNNGVSLSTQQKAKAKLGAEMALKLKGAMEHELMKTNAVFTELQKKQAQDEVALVQSMMLIDDSFEVGKFGTQDVFEYTVSLRDGKENVLTDLQKALDLLHETLGGFKEKQLLKKINFPFVVYASHQAVQKGLSAHTFGYWVNSFREKLVDKTNGVLFEGNENPNAWLYKVGSGAGATKAEKVAQRLKATNDELEAFYKELEAETKKEEIELERIRLEREKREKEQAETKVETKAKTKAETTKRSQAKTKAEKQVETTEMVVEQSELKI